VNADMVQTSVVVILLSVFWQINMFVMTSMVWIGFLNFKAQNVAEKVILMTFANILAIP